MFPSPFNAMSLQNPGLRLIFTSSQIDYLLDDAASQPTTSTAYKTRGNARTVFYSALKEENKHAPRSFKVAVIYPLHEKPSSDEEVFGPTLHPIEFMSLRFLKM